MIQIESGYDRAMALRLQSTEGYELQPVHFGLKQIRALAPEGTIPQRLKPLNLGN
jgi:hypothetical protein